MKDVLTSLRSLQAIDDEASSFLEERNELRQKLERLKELLELMSQELDEKKAKLAEASRWYKDKDSELKVDQDKVNKAKSKLATVTKNKEFMAMQREIESLRKSNVAREEEMLKLLQATETFKTSISEEETKIAQLRKDQAEEEQSSAVRIDELEKEISKISSRKNDILKGLKAPIITKYERIFNARQGLAIVAVSNGACTGCNFRITPHQLQAIYRAETLEQCRSCSRFLFAGLDEDVPVAAEESAADTADVVATA